MKERCGLGVAGFFLLMFTCGGSETQDLQRPSGSPDNIHSSGVNFSSRERRDPASNFGRLSGLRAGGGGAPQAWSKLGVRPGRVGSASGQGDISRHLVIDVSSADSADQVRPSPGLTKPPSRPVETVLGFETSDKQVPRKEVPPSDVRPFSGQTTLDSGQQSTHGTAGLGKQSAAVAPAGQLGREDISVEVDTVPRGTLSVSPRQSTYQARDSAAARQSGRPSGQRRLAKLPRQPSHPAMSSRGVRPGDANPRDSISVSAEMADGRPGGGGFDRVGQPSPAGAAPTGPDSHSPEWTPDAIPGQAGVDYPTLSDLPRSGFDCRGQNADGFYADTTDDARCQAFWICHNDQKDGFLCPNGTVFNQRYFACDWWFNVRCQDSPQYYELNRNIALLGTRLNSQPYAAPTSPVTGVHPVLTLLQDILQYPRVPPVFPHSSPEEADDSPPPIHSAAQPVLPSRNQYSDDAFHALDRSSVHVAGGVPGIPPAEGRAAGQIPKAPSHEAISSFIRLPEGRRGLARRYVKRHVERTPKKHRYRAKRHRGSSHLRERKVRGYDDMVHEAVELENAASALSARVPQIEQLDMSQLKKRAPEPASGAAFTAVQEGAMSDGQQSLLAGRSGPLLQTVDKVAFPMDVQGPDFPKVEEDFNVQETSGIRKSTSIKSVLPSHLDIPQHGAVNVMAASGSQQNADVYSDAKNAVGNQASIADLSDKQETGVARNFAGISLTEDVQLDKDVHGQVPGAVADTESVSGSQGQINGVSLVEDVEFDEKSSVSAPSTHEPPVVKSEPKSMAVMESVAGDNGQGRPGVSVQENVQVDQKRDVSGVDANQPPQGMQQSSTNNADVSNGGGNSNGPGVSVAENVQIERNSNSASGASSQVQQAAPPSPVGPSSSHGPGLTMTEDVDVTRQNSGPASREDTPTGMSNPMSGEIARNPGLSLTENVQIGHKDNIPSNGPNQNSQSMSGDSGGIGGQAMTGNLGPAGRPEPTNDVQPGAKMNVDGFLTDQTAIKTPPPPPPAGPAIRSEESVQVDFDQKSQNQQQVDMQENFPQTDNNQPPDQSPNSPTDAASRPEQQQSPVNSNPGPDLGSNQLHDEGGNGIKISPKAEQVLEEQSNVKILIPYDKDGGGFVPSGPIAADDQIGNMGIGNQVNTGIALGNTVSQGTQQGQQMGKWQDQSQRPQAESQGQVQSQQRQQVQSQDLQQNQQQPQQEPKPYEPQGQSQVQGELPKQVRSQLQIQQQGQLLQPNTAGLLNGLSASKSANTNSRQAPSLTGRAKEDVKISEDVSVHREPSGASASRPGYLHAGDARMNASAMTIPKKEGSSKILEELDARSQFASKVGDEPGTVKTHIQTVEEKLGDQPGISDLLDDPSALKREMPSENVKAMQQLQHTPPPEPQGEIIPGRKNVQITSESVSRIIKNPSQHRSAVKDPSGLDLPELLRPPGFGTNYSPFKAYPTMRTVKPVSPATPQPSVARLAGSIDMKSNNNAGGASPNTRTLTAGVSEKQTVPNSGGISSLSSAPGPQRTERGDLSAKLSDTLKMVDNILGPPPFKSKRNLGPKLQRATYLDTMETGHPSSLTGRGHKRASDGNLQDGNMGINLTVLINDQPDGQAPGQTGAAVTASAGQRAKPALNRAFRPSVKEKEKIRIFDSLKDMARKKQKGENHKKLKLKETADETEIKDVIEVQTLGDDGDTDKTYDYDISELPSWMKVAVKNHIKSPHDHSYSH